MFNPSLFPLSPGLDQCASGPNDPDGIQRHMRDCSDANGVWHSVRCTVEVADSLLSGRFVSTITLVGGLLALSAYW